jgi:hypothetical protein
MGILGVDPGLGSKVIPASVRTHKAAQPSTIHVDASPMIRLRLSTSRAGQS